MAKESSPPLGPPKVFFLGRKIDNSYLKILWGVNKLIFPPKDLDSMVFRPVPAQLSHRMIIGLTTHLLQRRTSLRSFGMAVQPPRRRRRLHMGQAQAPSLCHHSRRPPSPWLRDELAAQAQSPRRRSAVGPIGPRSRGPNRGCPPSLQPTRIKNDFTGPSNQTRWQTLPGPSPPSSRA